MKLSNRRMKLPVCTWHVSRVAQQEAPTYLGQRQLARAPEERRAVLQQWLDFLLHDGDQRRHFSFGGSLVGGLYDAEEGGDDFGDIGVDKESDTGSLRGLA